ncbi:MAG: adenine-specific methyltransferase EcoRI family protein [Armatimonadota bacterium]|nr:adenine-specific methyltransferase EcoRI family protein [Armatimonadota bacterium]
MSRAGKRTLSSARTAKQDEFYTQLPDIANELKHYKDQLRGKVVLCNCDDPYESHFFQYFALNFNELGLKKLICTSYAGSPIVGELFPPEEMAGMKPDKKEPYLVEINEVGDLTNDGAIGMADIDHLLRHDANASRPLKGNDTYGAGDFRSPECIEVLKRAHVVVTNPPFSLFREYVAQLVEHDKKFLIIGNKNAITYKEFFMLIQDNRAWLGTTPMGTDMLFDVPVCVAEEMIKSGKEGSNYKIVKGKVLGRSTSTWFTNMDHKKRHEEIKLFKKYTPGEYPKYDNYDAINVNKVADIPEDYEGAMGVPITFLGKHNPEQFEIIGNGQSMANELGIEPVGQKFVADYYAQGNKGQITAKWINLVYHIGTKVCVPYLRILIKHRRK